jgi:hypothetical protein
MPRDTWTSISNFIHFSQLCPVASSTMELPMLPWHVVTLLCSLLGLYVYRTIMMYAKLREFRGPSWTGISNWPHSMAMLGGNCHEWYAEVNKKYGARHLPGSYCACIYLGAGPPTANNSDSSQARLPESRLESCSRPLPKFGCM